MSARGLVLAAPSSGAGKTTLTLGLLRAFRRDGVDVRAAKSGPDYIDPAFHAVASGSPSVNLDAWAMRGEDLRARAAAQGGELLIVEGAMGVLDGARDGTGSAADLAQALGFPVVLVLDIAKQGQSAPLAAAGLRALKPDLPLAGVILNRAGSPRHAAIAREALEDAGITVFGTLYRDATLALPERHLGLVQASETAGIDGFLEHAADAVRDGVDMSALLQATGLARPGASAGGLPPPAQRIAVARDIAFAFAYPHMLDDWRAAGAELRFFSPLANEAPDREAGAVFLPGGYPELHAGTLAQAQAFRAGMAKAAAHGAVIYGECGGYMVLGEGLVDKDGARHQMLGLLPLETSFAKRKLTLGYRRLEALGGPFSGALMAHEFHYATITREGAAERLFTARDATGEALGEIGLRVGRVAGSFAHVIGPAFNG
ncbi:MAG: cobyrinate a,c-diamide synthase [Brevirhabdus sp.]